MQNTHFTHQDLILALDTTMPRLMIGLYQNQGPQNYVCLESVNQVSTSFRYHSAVMIPTIQRLLAHTGSEIKDLTALAVNHGPGSFTGVRTGLLSVRLMAQFLSLPVHEFNTFELLAAQAFESEGATLNPIEIDIEIDALRGRAYTAKLSWSEDGPLYPQMPQLEFLGRAIQAVPDEWFSPAQMMSLIGRYGQRFSKSWQEIHPFYLQEPAATC